MDFVNILIIILTKQSKRSPNTNEGIKAEQKEIQEVQCVNVL